MMNNRNNELISSVQSDIPLLKKKKKKGGLVERECRWESGLMGQEMEKIPGNESGDPLAERGQSEKGFRARW